MNKLEAGSVIEYAFPELPPTLQMLVDEENGTAKMFVGLPCDYSENT